MLLVYLADWKGAIDLGKQISDADWVRSSWGPYSRKVVSAWARLNQHPQHAAAPETAEDQLDSNEVAIVHEMDERWREKPLPELLKITNSTFPLLAVEPDHPLDLPGLAERYKREFKKQLATA
jgi:hypothetical protein